MFYYIKGKVTLIKEDFIVLENNGLGYTVYVPKLSIDYIKENLEDIILYTSMVVREDDIKLYGFASNDDLELFDLLVSVSGVGGKAALGIMSSINSNDLRKMIAFEDIKSLTKAQGVGKKTAQRIVLELKDKIGYIEDGDYDLSESLESIESNLDNDAIMALTTLGYSRSEAFEAIRRINKDTNNVEDIIMEALKILGKN